MDREIEDNETPDTTTLQAALDQAEEALQACGRDLRFHVTADGGVEIVRRGLAGESPREVVATLAGCDPLLWQTDATSPDVAGPVTLGLPYRDAHPRCALSGQPITVRAPLELYYRGRPISADRALELAPLLVLVRGAVAAAGSVLRELGGIGDQVAGVENSELRRLLVERGVRELAKRWTGGVGEVPGVVVGVAGGEGDRRSG